MPTLRTPALVLRAYDFSEADRVIVLFTQTLGKVKGVAKGVRRTASRLNGCLGWLSRAELQLAGRENQDLFRITQGQLLQSYPHLKENLPALGRAARMAELLFSLTHDHQPLPEIFELAETSLSLWDAGTDPNMVGTWFEWMFLDRMGYRPQVEVCQQCGNDTEHMSYHPETDGITCRACRPHGGIVLSAGTRKMLNKLIASHPTLLPSLRLGEDAQTQIQTLLDSIIRNHLGRPLKSDSFQRAVCDLK
jgi:DNA repair protein RecO (recombination protein O)